MFEVKADANEPEVEVWGWEDFFELVSNFLVSYGRHYESPTEALGQSTIEKLETCIISLQGIKEVIEPVESRICSALVLKADLAA